MENYFNQKTLLILTLLIVFLGAVSYFDDDLSLPVIMLAGFIYTIVLWIAIRDKPIFSRFLVVFFALGIANYFSLLAAYPLMLLPQSIADQVTFVLPSLVGAIITILCIMKVWKIKLSKHQVILILGLISLSSLLCSQIDLYVQENIRNHGLTLIFNSVLWWLMFSLGIILPSIFTKKEGKINLPSHTSSLSMIIK